MRNFIFFNFIFFQFGICEAQEITPIEVKIPETKCASAEIHNEMMSDSTYQSNIVKYENSLIKPKRNKVLVKSRNRE